MANPSPRPPDVDSGAPTAPPPNGVAQPGVMPQVNPSAPFAGLPPEVAAEAAKRFNELGPDGVAALLMQSVQPQAPAPSARPAAPNPAPTVEVIGDADETPEPEVVRVHSTRRAVAFAPERRARAYDDLDQIGEGFHKLFANSAITFGVPIRGVALLADGNGWQVLVDIGGEEPIGYTGTAAQLGQALQTAMRDVIAAGQQPPDQEG